MELSLRKGKHFAERHRGLYPQSHAVYFGIVGVLLIAAFTVSLSVGRYPVSLGDIPALLFGGTGGSYGTVGADSTARAVFFTLRLPRTLMALLAGAGLGMVGSVFQLIFKNPLAAPEIIGVSNGANLGAALSIVLFGQTAALPALAFCGGMLSLTFVAALARVSRNRDTVTYILAGIVTKSVSDAFIMILKINADPERELAAMEYWAMGSLGSITAGKLITVLPFFAVGMLGLILLRRQIPLLGLEEDESRSLGVNVRLIRLVILGFAALTVSSVLSQTGLILFAGLIAPHAARLALKRIYFGWCVLSALMGAVILLFADCFARSVFTAEIPISIPTTFIGVPVLLYFMHMRKRSRI